MNVNEKITLQGYQPQWKTDYEQEKKEILDCLNKYQVNIEHIGSTSVKGMCAKPIIDILIGVQHFPPSDDIVQAIVDIGYEYMKEASVSNRLYFIKRIPKKYNVHIVKFRDKIWNNDIAFRDYLRQNPNAVREYSRVKRETAENGIDTLLEYSDAKAPFIFKLLNQMQH